MAAAAKAAVVVAAVAVVAEPAPVAAPLSSMPKPAARATKTMTSAKRAPS